MLFDELIDEGKLDLPRYASMRKIADRADVSPTTATKHFEDIYAVCAALTSRSRQAGRTQRKVIEQLADTHYTRGADPATRLAARLQHKPIYLAKAHEIFSDAEQQKNAILKIEAASAVARAYLEGTSQDLGECLTWVERAFAFVDDDQVEHIRAALEATEIAAQAARRLSRDDTLEVRYLRVVREYKHREERYARRLHYLSRAALAAFHATRATALLEDDIDGEITAFAEVSTALKAATNGGERVDPDDIAEVVSRLCTVQLAYPGRAHELSSARTALMQLLRPSGARSAVNELISAVDSTPEYDSNTSAIAMMKMLRFGAVGYLCVGRILERKYRQTEHGTVPSSEDGLSDEALGAALGLSPDISHVLAIDPDEFLQAALSYYTRTHTETRKSGSAGKLRDQALEDRERLLSEHDAIREVLEVAAIPAMNDATVAGITAAIDRLVMRGLVAERADRNQVVKIRRHIDPIHQFLS